MTVEQPIFWAPWHPKHEFEIPFYDGPVVFTDIDGAARIVKSLNADDKTTNRNGWRATKVSLTRVLR